MNSKERIGLPLLGFKDHHIIMKYVQEIEDHGSLRALVLQDLKDLSIKPPKSKKNQKNRDDSIVSIGEHQMMHSWLPYIHVLLYISNVLQPMYPLSIV